jgi:hypothetical protein
MMSNFILFDYQHTCKKGQPAYILQKAPFKSNIKRKNGKLILPFLGEGHYFWEENRDAANRWGKKHYKDTYNIVEFKDLNVPKDELLDFLDRRNLKYFNELKQRYTAKRPASEKWDLGQWIEFFKKVNTKQPDLFPFKYFRADENYPNHEDNLKNKKQILFSNSAKYFTYLDPLFILCALEKDKLNFESKLIAR